MSVVEYRVIENYPDYRAGSDGSLWSLKAGRSKPLSAEWRRLRTPVNSHGYRIVQLCDGVGGRKSFRLGRLVLTAFTGGLRLNKECCHRNGDRTDDRLSNLYWGTKEENEHDKRRHGTVTAGTRNGNAKFTDDQILLVRSMKGKLNSRQAADLIGCSDTYVQKLWKGVNKRLAGQEQLFREAMA